MFRGGPAHLGVYDAPLGTALAGLQWRFDTQGGVIGSPAIRGDTVWVGSGDGRVYALALSSGALLWSFNLTTPIASSPAVAGDVVVIGARDGRFNGLNARTGEPLWSVETGTDLPLPWGHESGDRFTSSPAIVNDLAVVAAGDGVVRALEWRTGRERWHTETGTRLRSSPAVADGRVFIGGVDGRLYAFDLASGTRLWAFATEGATLQSEHYGFDRRTIQSSPAVQRGTVYVGARDGFLYAVSADSGVLRWRFDHQISWIISSPAVADDVVYAGSSDGQFIQAVDAETGVERWRRPTGSIVWSSPAIVGQQLLVGDGRGRVLALDRMTGDPRWEFFTGGQVFSSPVPAGRQVVFGSVDGGVYALCTGDPVTLERAVYPGRGGTPADSVAGLVTAALQVRGYQVLDDQKLIAVLTAAVADGRLATVVFASDDLPPEIVTEPVEQSLFRRFLDAGGKAVWTSIPPLLWPRDSTGQRLQGLAGLTWDRPAQLLGVSHAAAIFDRRSVEPTDPGRRWGLSGRWR
ncbi:MAG TPA: PQQ-binding-like beta-propeller repeat protein, partial [Gemmatimonadales bacterium]